MTDDLYRVSFIVPCPINEADYRVITAVSAGNYRGDEGFERFTKLTAHYDSISFSSIPLSADRAVELKLRFSGEMKKID